MSNIHPFSMSKEQGLQKTHLTVHQCAFTCAIEKSFLATFNIYSNSAVVIYSEMAGTTANFIAWELLAAPSDVCWVDLCWKEIVAMFFPSLHFAILLHLSVLACCLAWLILEFEMLKTFWHIKQLALWSLSFLHQLGILWNRTVVEVVDKLSSTSVDFIRSERKLEKLCLYGVQHAY